LSTNPPPLDPSSVAPPASSPRDVVVEGERHVSEVASAPRVSRRVQTQAIIAGGALLIGVILLTSPSSTTRKAEVATRPTIAAASRYEPPPLPQQPVIMPDMAAVQPTQPTQSTAPPIPAQPYGVAAQPRGAAQARAQSPAGSSGLLVYTSGGSASGASGGQIVPSIADDSGERGASAQRQGAEGGARGTTPATSQGSSVASLSAEPGGLGARLTPTRLTGVSANIIAHPSYTLTMGTLMPCILQTAMDSSLPGLVTCVVPQDILGKTGLTLLDRGTRVVGEFRGGVTQGVERLFVVWTRAETPQGVVINIDSPASDPLGRSGFDGQVDRHFWQRFGGALLLTTVNGIVQAGTSALSKGGTTSINTGSTDSVIASTLSGSISIPPTIRKNQGELVSIFVARDLDFSSVYSVHPTGMTAVSAIGRQSVSTAGLP